MSKHVFKTDVWRFLLSDTDFSDELAKRLEIEVDGGDTPGGFLRGVIDQWRDEWRLDLARERLASIESEIATKHPQGGEDE